MKKYSTIGCCGIDCGLCPRFYTKGDSVCSGCGGIGFKDKHPTCGFVTCCVTKRGLETCADCIDYPCSRFDAERKGYDSFVTHKKVFANLDTIRASGIDSFIIQQTDRIRILTDFIVKCDDGRSKSFYCISCALLPLDKLKESHSFMMSLDDTIGIKVRCKRLKELLQNTASDLSISLKLNKK